VLDLRGLWRVGQHFHVVYDLIHVGSHEFSIRNAYYSISADVLYCAIIYFHGPEISWFDNEGYFHVDT